jgi:AraC-like DNA-binding protein
MEARWSVSDRGAFFMSTDAIAHRFRVRIAPTLRSSTPCKSPITISRIACDEPEHGPSRPVAVEDAYVASVAVADLVSAEIRIHGKTVQRGGSPPGGLYLFNLQTDPICHFHTAFDFVRFYISRATLERLARDAETPVTGSLERPTFGALDPVIFNLAQAALPALGHADSASQLFVDYIALAFHAHLVRRYAGPCLDLRRTRPGLAPWQMRLATELIDSSLDGKLSIDALARECHLSQSYFSRAFVQTLGMPPHRYLLRRRVDRARQLLEEGKSSLAEITVLCGFGSQSHFTRVFTALEGVSPGRWRRQTVHTSDASESRTRQ